MTSVVLPGSGGTVSFRYDPFGRRIQKASPSATTNYVYEGAGIVEEVDGAGLAGNRYSQGSGIDEPLAMTAAGSTSYYQADGLGSITGLSDSSGTQIQTYSYDVYGKTINASGSISNPFQYTAREFDGDIGLNYYRARYYDPTVGRFLNEDQLRFVGGMNFYPYVGGSPTNSTDPSGLFRDNGKLQPKPWDLRDLIIALLKDPNNNECKCWFKTGRRSLAETIRIISYVPIVFTSAPQDIGGLTGEDAKSPIEINTEGSFYPTSPYGVGHTSDGHPIYDPGSFEAQMVILLHELAHKAMPKDFKSDGKFEDPPGASEDNTRLVIEHCKDAIKWLKVLYNEK